MMTKPIVVLLSILIFYVLQVSTQNCVGPFRNKKKVIVKVNNTGFFPDCLIVRDGQSVVWEWEEFGEHTITSNAGPFGDCNDNTSPILAMDMDGLYKGDKIKAGPFNYDPNDPLNNEFYYKCAYHCDSGMYGTIQIVKRN